MQVFFSFLRCESWARVRYALRPQRLKFYYVFKIKLKPLRELTSRQLQTDLIGSFLRARFSPSLLCHRGMFFTLKRKLNGSDVHFEYQNSFGRNGPYFILSQQKGS